MAKQKHYLIQHASGAKTTVTGLLFNEHIRTGNLLKIAKQLALVAPGLACWFDGEQLHFTERHEHGFSGDEPIHSQWAAVLSAWLYQPPFPHLSDINHLICYEHLSPVEASVQAVRRGTH
jgi:hypothetical protein